MAGPAVGSVLMGFLSCRTPALGMIAISIGQTFGEFAFMGGYFFSIFELAPQYAGILTGITNTFGVLPGFLCPLFVAWMTPNGTREEWVNVFLLSAGLNIFGALVYIIFGSSELQRWAMPGTPVNEEKMGVTPKIGEQQFLSTIHATIANYNDDEEENIDAETPLNKNNDHRRLDNFH